MAAVVDVKVFEALFAKPSIEGMLELDWSSFEKFVMYVFQRAGFGVEHAGLQFGPGFDLKLYVGGEVKGKPSAYVSIKQYKQGHRVGSPEINTFRGALAAAANAPGYLVTTSDFTDPAKEEATKTPRLRLVDGEHLVRFISYVAGSRYELASNVIVAPDWILAADSIARRPNSQTAVLALANNKGGVGKTTTALNLAAGLASERKRILLIDMDAQANLSDSLPFPQGVIENPPNLTDYFSNRYSLGQLVRRTQIDNVWLIPAHRDLRKIDPGAVRPDMELRFMSDVHHASLTPPPFEAEVFDWIILDTPPAMSFFTRAALAASHFVLAPAIPRAYAPEGIQNLLETTVAMRALVGSGAEVLGVAVTHWEDVQQLRDAYLELEKVLNAKGVHLFKARIPNDREIDKAQAKRVNFLGMARRPSRGAVAYKALTEEVLSHVKHG